MTPALQVSRLAKTYGERTVLHATTFALQAGEALGLAGANGAGKTTLLGLVAGLVRPTLGQAHIHGLPITDPASRAGLGFVPEQVLLPARQTVHEFLADCARLTGSPPDRVPEVLQDLALEPVARRRTGHLSRGERQRVALAQALLHKPGLIVLDEPLTGLDAGGQQRLLQTLARHKRAGSALLVATHHATAFDTLLDRHAQLSSGRFLLEAP
jgi:ABC-type multidrug transport system ATPase subunit